jgi:phosphoribosyl-ATP pyrophosphohydrolase
VTETLDELFATIAARKSNPPPESYTAKLFAAGRTEIAKKVGEEAVEIIVAALSDGDARLISESADLVYHLLVLLADRGIQWRAVETELASRRAVSHPPSNQAVH